jgi:hypothetical protein
MVRLYYACLSIPSQTAMVERGFSLHRLFKNRLTNRLRLMTLDSLLRLKLLCSSPSAFLSGDYMAPTLAILTRQSIRQNGGKPPAVFTSLHNAVHDIIVPILEGQMLANGVDVEDGDVDEDVFWDGGDVEEGEDEEDVVMEHVEEEEFDEYHGDLADDVQEEHGEVNMVR